MVFDVMEELMDVGLLFLTLSSQCKSYKVPQKSSFAIFKFTHHKKTHVMYM